MPLTSERIQNMMEKEEPPLYKPERYTSKFKSEVAREWRENKKERKTMGNAIEVPPLPNEFLKRHSSRKLENITHQQHKCMLTERRPPIPKMVEENVGSKKCRNFLQENIRRAVKSAPACPRPKFVDTHRGNIQNVDNSGLQPRYLFKTNYGNLPRFVTEHKKKIENLGDNEMSISSENSKTHTKLSEEQREQLLKGLKNNLSEKNHKFLLLPVIIDTPYLINYKRRLEKTIIQLERDIQNIEEHPTIYISN